MCRAICTKCEYHIHSSLSHSDVWVQAPPFVPFVEKNRGHLSAFRLAYVCVIFTIRNDGLTLQNPSICPYRLRLSASKRFDVDHPNVGVINQIEGEKTTKMDAGESKEDLWVSVNRATPIGNLHVQQSWVTNLSNDDRLCFGHLQQL